MDYEAALARAAAENRWTIVMFTAKFWCPFCHALDVGPLADPAWQAYVAARGFMLVCLDFNRRNNFDKTNPFNMCFLWHADYLAANGLTEAEGDARLAFQYELQAKYTMPALTRVPYPTWIVLRPDGSRAGRPRVVNTRDQAPATETIIRRVEQTLLSDPQDEMDDDARLAPTLLEADSCEEAGPIRGSLSENDLADVFQFEAVAGTEWTFNLLPAEGLPTHPITISLIGPDKTNVLEQATLTPASNAVYRFRTQSTTLRYLRLAPASPVTHLIGYALGYASAPYSGVRTVYHVRASLSSLEPRAGLRVVCDIPDQVCRRARTRRSLRGFAYHYDTCAVTPEFLLYFVGSQEAYAIRGGQEAGFRVLNLMGRRKNFVEGLLDLTVPGVFSLTAAGFGQFRMGIVADLSGQAAGRAAPRLCQTDCETPIPSVVYPLCGLEADAEAEDILVGSWAMRVSVPHSRRASAAASMRAYLAEQLPRSIQTVIEDGIPMRLSDWAACD